MTFRKIDCNRSHLVESAIMKRLRSQILNNQYDSVKIQTHFQGVFKDFSLFEKLSVLSTIFKIPTMMAVNFR